MEFEPTRLPEIVLIKPRVFGDARGFFFETWQEQKFAAAGIAMRFVRDNHSHSTRYTLRGLHFQIQQPQGKLVRVARGEVFDVAVDIWRSATRSIFCTSARITMRRSTSARIDRAVEAHAVALAGQSACHACKYSARLKAATDAVTQRRSYTVCTGLGGRRDLSSRAWRDF